MKKSLIFTSFFLVIAISIFAFIYFGPASEKNSLRPLPEGKTHLIVLNETGYSPSEITIKPGDIVKFSTTLTEPYWPASDLHPTHGIYPEFDPQEPVDPKNSWSFQFLKPGKWKFHDHLQPFYRGIIIVGTDEEGK